MFNQISYPKTYTPDEVASILQLSRNTVYELIKKGEIIAKKIGKVYRVPPASLSFVFSGLDLDLYQAQLEDLKTINNINQEIKKVRKNA